MKQNLFKTLLLAATLLVGGANCAWGADTFLTTWTGQVGTAGNEGNFKYATKKVQIAAGETYVYTLTNFNDGNNSNYWKNWVVEGYLDGKYFDCEARGNQWQANGGPVPSYTPVMAYTDVENFQTAYNGATVTITISRNAAGDQFTVTHTSNVLGTTAGNTEKYYGGTWTVAVGAEEEWDIYITEEEAHFVVTNVSYTDAESNVTNYNLIYERGTINAWAASDVASGQWSSGAVTEGLSAAGGKLSQSGTNAEYSSTKSISPTSGYKVSMTAVATMGSASGRNGSYDYLKIGGAELRVLGQDQKAQVYIDGVAQGSTVTATRNAAYTFNVLINQTTGDVTYSVSGGATIAETKTSTSTAISNAVVGHYKAGKENYGTTINLTNISVTEETYSVPTANYTVHFVDNNSATIKDDDVRKGEVDATVGASTADKATFIADGNKYVYSSDGGGTTVTANGLAEFTVTYTKYVSTAYTVKAQVSGSDITTLASGTAYLDGSTTEYWSKYIEVSDQWYVADETTYGAVITTATNNVAFTATDDIDYFFEAEGMTYSRTYNEYKGTAASNGQAKTLYGDANAVTTTTVAPGVYTVSLKGIKWQDGYADTYQIAYSVNGSDWIALGNIAYADGEEGVKTLANAIIPTTAYLRIWTTQGAQTPRRYLDYMALEKTGDVATMSIKADKWGTFIAPFDVTIPTGVEAYKVTGVSGIYLVKEAVETTISANTPVVLKNTTGADVSETFYGAQRTADSYTVGNLTGVYTAATIPASDGDHVRYVLQTKSGVQAFYKVASDFTATPNKCYLSVPSEAVKAAFFELGDADAISDVRSKMEEGRNEIFNLAGQRLNKAQKGVNIVNGKKVLVK